MLEHTDLISPLLRPMQVAASLLLSERFLAPWSVDLPGTEDLVGAFGFLPGTHVIAFHLVREGHLNLSTSDGERTVCAGQVVILFRGQAHRMWCGKGASRTSLEMVLAGTRPGPSAGSTLVRSESAQRGSSGHIVDQSQNACATRLLCGAFTMRHTRLNPLFDALPSVAVISLDNDDASGWLAAVAKQLVAEIEQPTDGSAFVVDRLLELFCAASVREYMVTCGPSHGGWFGAIHDPPTLRALNAIHQDPSFGWTVESLATKAGLSRSRLSERFARTVGEPPMQYLTKWRMNAATRLLAETRHSVQRIANDVGYESAAAFSRAFKQYLGISPAKFRTDDRQWAQHSATP